MALYETDGTLSSNDQMQIRSKEQEILGSKDSPQLKAAKVKQLYESYGLQPGSFRNPQYAQSGSGESYSGSSDAPSGSSIKWTIIVFVGLYLLFKGCATFQEHFPAQGDAFRAGFNATMDFIFGGIGRVFAWILK